MNRLLLLILLCMLSVNLLAEREAKTISERELVNAVMKNDTISIYRLIDENVAVDITNFEEVSLLMLASQKNNKDLVKLLVKKGADPNYQISSEMPSPLGEKKVLDFAFKSNDPAMIELLIRLGAKLNIKDLENTLTKASLDNNVDMVKYLLKKGVRVSNDVGQFLVVSHMKRKQDPIYKQMIIRKNEDFRIVKIWENYGIAINENTLIKAKLLEKKNITKYITAYKEWKANGSPDPEPIKQQEIQTQPSQEQLDSIAKETEIRLAQEEVQIASERVVTAQRLQQEKETRDKELKNFIYVIGALFVLFALRRKLVIWIKQLYKKLKTPLSIFSKLRFNRQSKTQRSYPIEKATINQSVYTIEKGWTVDDTLKLEVNYLTIEDIINPIRMTNEHERYVREMIWYVRKVEKTNEDKQQVNDMLVSKWKQVNPKLVRSIFRRSLLIILENYSKQNSKVKQLAKNVKFKQ